MEVSRSSSEVLKNKIQEESAAEVSSILSQADKESQDMIGQAEAEAQKIRSETLRKAESEAEAVEKRILSGVHLEVKKIDLQSREKLFLILFKKVEEKLNGFRRSKGYAPILEKIIIEGVQALDTQEVVVQLSEIERKLLDKTMLADINNKIQKKTGKQVLISISKESLPDVEGGAVLVSADGRTRFDNRFRTRMRRVEKEMRLTVMKELTK